MDFSRSNGPKKDDDDDDDFNFYHLPVTAKETSNSSTKQMRQPVEHDEDSPPSFQVCECLNIVVLTSDQLLQYLLKWICTLSSSISET